MITLKKESLKIVIPFFGWLLAINSTMINFWNYLVTTSMCNYEWNIIFCSYTAESFHFFHQQFFYTLSKKTHKIRGHYHTELILLKLPKEITVPNF